MKKLFFLPIILLILLAIPFQLWSDNPPILTIQPAPQYDYIFGFVEVGKIAEKEMYIINTGQGVLSGSVTLENEEQNNSDNEKVFFISGDTNFSLFANQSAVVKIQFIPLKAKEYQGKLKVVASENQSAEITLKGVGNKPPKAYYIFGCGQSSGSKISYCMDFIVILFTSLFLTLRKIEITN
ncbi:MAG: hypothetical protein ACP5UA_05045 [Candidatus Hydrogenedens sp.]